MEQKHANTVCGMQKTQRSCFSLYTVSLSVSEEDNVSQMDFAVERDKAFAYSAHNGIAKFSIKLGKTMIRETWHPSSFKALGCFLSRGFLRYFHHVSFSQFAQYVD